MYNPEEDVISILKRAGVDFTASLPCEKFKALLDMAAGTREEEGVGICAGAALAGKRPAMFIQSSGIGNMINALLSLTGFYRLPLALFISQRGIYKEKIEAQFPMGKGLPKILQGAGIPFSLIHAKEDFRMVGRRLKSVYEKGAVHAFLLSPALWEGSCAPRLPVSASCPISARNPEYGLKEMAPRYRRYEILRMVSRQLRGKVVVCNLGFPSKELFRVMHQSSNFYMLGSMGMATPIGLGISLSTDKEVVVIDGDGSLLMNPGTLATAANLSPRNLTIFAVDNSAYGSTGNQPTLTGSCVDLELLARAFGIKETLKAATKTQLVGSLRGKHRGMRFVHALAVSGNQDVPNITLHHMENKKQVQDFILAG